MIRRLILIAVGAIILSASGTLAGRLGKDQAFAVTGFRHSGEATGGMAHGYVATVAVSNPQDHRFGVQVEGGGNGISSAAAPAAIVPSRGSQAATIVKKVGIGVESCHQRQGLGLLRGLHSVTS